MTRGQQVSRRDKVIDREINIGEEEIIDVSLAAFHVLDNENAARSNLGQKLVPGGGGCGGGCACSKGCGS